jgi:CDP-glycerol glycerophosphotransferase
MKKIKKILVDFAKKNIVFRKILRTIRRVEKNLNYQRYYYRYKVNDKMIFFETFNGRNYGCSPKAIYEQMLNMKEFKDYTFIWSFNDVEKHKVKENKNLIIIRHGSSDYFKYLAMSKYWIVNSIIEESVKKKENQVYVQCWHGTPLKRLRYDIEVNGAVLNTISEIRKRNDIDASRFNYFLSPSKFCTEKFTSAFNLINLGKKDIIIEEGYPRNDSLFHYTKEEIEKLKKKFKIPNGKKAIFYLPTFRDNQHASGIGYTYQLAIDFDRLKEKFGDKYVILFSPHYFIAKQVDVSKYEGFVINVSDNDDINELYMVSDIIMTDYSSVFFDFANLKKPMIFYMYDLDLYKGKLRDFYLDLEELPGPITETQEQLEDAIENIDSISKTYKEKYKKFNQKFNYLDDGNASERVINKIFNLKK